MMHASDNAYSWATGNTCWATIYREQVSHVVSGTKIRCNICTLGNDRTPTLQSRHNRCDGVSNHQPHDCLLNLLFRRRSKKRSKLRVTGLCAGNSPVTGEFPAQMASKAENVSIWWRHDVDEIYDTLSPNERSDLARMWAGEGSEIATPNGSHRVTWPKLFCFGKLFNMSHIEVIFTLFTLDMHKMVSHTCNCGIYI